MLCRTAFSIQSIVARWGKCKPFLLHSERSQNSRKNSLVPRFSRTITALRTAYPLVCPQTREMLRVPTNGARWRCGFTTASFRRHGQHEERTAGDRYDTFCRLERQFGKPREAPERRENCAPRTDDEARQPRRLLAAAEESHTRMQVTAERIAGRRSALLVTREKGRQCKWLVDAANVPIRGWIASARIVIAANEHDIRLRVRVAPCDECITQCSDPARLRVQEIAEHDETCCARALEQARQSREVGGRRTSRQRHATGAKRCRFAEMHVSDEHDSLSRPMQCTFGVECNALATDDGVEHAIDGACGRRCF